MKTNYYPEEIMRELKKIDTIKAIFNDNDLNSWSKLKHNEDFDRIYQLEPDVKFKIEKIYSEGRSIAHDMMIDLDYNYIEKYPTTVKFIDNFRNNYIKILKELKQLSSDIKSLVKEQNINIWAINSMIRLYDEQIGLIENIELIFKEIENTNTFKKNSSSIFNKIKQNKLVSSVVIIAAIFSGGIGYIDDILSKIQNIDKIINGQRESLPKKIEKQNLEEDNRVHNGENYSKEKELVAQLISRRKSDRSSAMSELKNNYKANQTIIRLILSQLSRSEECSANGRFNLILFLRHTKREVWDNGMIELGRSLVNQIKRIDNTSDERVGNKTKAQLQLLEKFLK